MEVMHGVAQYVDELVQLQTELDAADVSRKLKRIEELKKSLRIYLSSAPAEEQVVLQGNVGSATFSKCSMYRRVVHNKKLKRLLGAENFTNLAKFSLEDLSFHLTDAQIDSVCNVFQGSRSLMEVHLIEEKK